MFAYRFKMNFEEQDGFYRDVELGVDQTFLNFYNIIIDSLSLDKTVPCSFFICDHRYRKKKEIIMPSQDQNQENEPANEQSGDQKPKLRMDKCYLNDLIDDPHQKFLFIYDIPKEWTFYIELSKIVSREKGETYPRIIKAVGPVPQEISRKPRPLPGLDDEDIAETEQEAEEMDISPEAEGTYGEEDLDEFDDSSFYNDAVDSSQDFDERKL
ncbi:MAG: hypothetical protein EA393_14340 [Bacteroidetes bacterium]|nr:MAG: hypothetical protein EA393_14340 [Bacteroidota bacterium]